MISVDMCPLCNGTDLVIRYNTIPIKIALCKNCLLCFSSEQMSQSEIHTYYREDFSSERHRKGQIINALVNSHLIVANDIELHDKKILDVGCGYGYLMQALKKKSKHSSLIYGVEISDVERSQAEELLENSSIIYSNLDKIEDESFDIVTCCEVLEHIKDPLSFVNILHRKLRDGGRLFMLTDNFESAIVRQMQEDYPKWIPHSHIVHFGPSSFRELFLLSDFGIKPLVKFFTPAELYIIKMRHKIKQFLHSDSRVDFAEYGRQEFKRDLGFFRLRLVFNYLAVKIFGSSSFDGTLMFTIIQKT